MLQVQVRIEGWFLSVEKNAYLKATSGVVPKSTRRGKKGMLTS